MAGCGASFSRIILIIVNIIFVLLGLGMGIAGLIFKYGSDILKQDIKDALGKVNLDVLGGVDVATLVESLSNFLIVLGFIIFGIGFFGFCGACCKWKWMLVIYAIIVVLVLIAQIVAIALFASFKGKISSEFSDAARKALKEDYNKTTAVKDGFNKMFETFKCCGIGNYTDVSVSIRYLPEECCGGKPCTSAGDVYPGCFQKVDDLFHQYNAAFIGIGVSILVFQVLCVIFAICLCRADDDD